MGAAAIFNIGLSAYVKRAFSRYPPADRQGAGWGGWWDQYGYSYKAVM